MDTQRIPVADGVELAADTWAPAAGALNGNAAPFILVHGLASNARMWDGVRGASSPPGHRSSPWTCAATADRRSRTGRTTSRTVADDLAALIDALGLDRPSSPGSPGAATSCSSWRRASRRTSAGSSAWTAAGSNPAAASRTGRPAGRPSPRRASSAARLAEIEGYIRSAHADWPETGIRGTLANFEVRTDGTVAPWLTYERHLAVLRGHVGAPSLGALRGRRGARCCSCRPTAARAPRPSASGGRGGGPRRPSRTPGHAGSAATTTSTRSIRPNSQM